MLVNILCFAGGTLFGAFIMCAMSVAKDTDERSEKDK